MKLKSKFIILFTFLMMTLIILGSILYYFSAENAITNRINAQLESVGVLKENQIYHIIDHHTYHITEYAQYPIVQILAQQIHNNTYHTISPQEQYTTLQYLSNISKHASFKELFILTTDGRVAISTDPNQTGKMKTNEPYFQNGHNTTYLQSYYYDVSLQQQAITISTPIQDQDNNLLGILAARMKPELISEIMLERSGLGESGQTYLVNSINLLVTDTINNPEHTFRKTIYTYGATQALAQNNGFSEYQDFTDTTVLGSYRWLPKLNVALLTEIHKDEAFNELTSVNQSLFATSTILFLLGLIFIYFITKKMIKPLETLTTAATQFGENKNISINQTNLPKDELGDLAHAFQHMIQNISIQQQEIKKHSETLETKVQTRTQELQKSKKELETLVSNLQRNKVAMLNLLNDLQNTQIELEQKNIDLDRANKLKSDFLNVTSHELRTPMSAIKGYVQMLLKEKLGDVNNEQQKGLNIILRNTNRLDHLIQDILDISRLESGTMKFMPQPTNLNTLATEITDTMQSYANTKNITITSNLIPKLPTLNIDEDRIKQVLINLLNNAIKFSEPNSTIELNTTKSSNKLIFEVRDYGRGIPKTEHDHVFETFYQVDQGMGRKFGGAGLGLAISRGIVLAHGGRIWVHDIDGKGASVRFSLPIESVKNVEERFKEIDIFNINKREYHIPQFEKMVIGAGKSK